MDNTLQQKLTMIAEALTVEAENIVYNLNFDYLCKHGKK